MNELIAVLSFIGFAIAVVVAARLGKTALFVLSATFIIISNVTVQMPVAVFGMEISWAIIIYSLIYFITDILCEYHGKTTGYRLAATNLAVQLILWAYVFLSLQVTPVESGKAMYGTMEKLFGTTAQVTFAAIVASAGPFLDIFVFSWIRQKWDVVAQRHIDGKTALALLFNNRVLALVARNKLSTLAGQIVNTVLFFSLALFDTGIPTGTLVSIIVSASAIKVLIALADIPFLIAVEKSLSLRPRAA
jgi:queuosine precursor transporter